MSKWLTQEWLDETRKMGESQPERPGATARMQYIITGGPDGDVHYYWILENGKLLESQLGDLPDADFSMTQSYDDALKIQRSHNASAKSSHSHVVIWSSRIKRSLWTLIIESTTQVTASRSLSPSSLATQVVSHFSRPADSASYN